MYENTNETFHEAIPKNTKLFYNELLLLDDLNE